MTIEQTRKLAYDGDVDSYIRLMQDYAKGDGGDMSLNQAKTWGHKAIILIAFGSKHFDVVKGKDCNELHSLAVKGDVCCSERQSNFSNISSETSARL